MKKFLICISFVISGTSGLVFAQTTEQSQSGERNICFIKCSSLIGSLWGGTSAMLSLVNPTIINRKNNTRTPNTCSFMIPSPSSSDYYEVIHKGSNHNKDEFNKVVNSYLEGDFCRSLTYLGDSEDFLSDKSDFEE